MKKKTALSKRRKKIYTTKGALSAGMTYVILTILIIIAGGMLMTGSIIPLSTKSPEGGQPVITLPASKNPAKNDLQLFTFPGATYTPTPSPTPTPTPTPPPDDDDGGDDGGSCFPKGTKILLANGKQKNIEEIKIGDKIMGFDGTKQISETVLELEAPIRNHLYKLTFADGSVLRLTKEHPLFTPSGWKSISPKDTISENPGLSVGTLTVGEKILNIENNFIKIISIEYIPGKVQTYNLKKVTGFNNFYADGKLAHNKGGGDNPGSAR